MSKENKSVGYFKGAFQELSKVTWPTQKQAVRLTVIVLVFCLITAIILGGLDFLFGQLHAWLIGL